MKVSAYWLVASAAVASLAILPTAYVVTHYGKAANWFSHRYISGEGTVAKFINKPRSAETSTERTRDGKCLGTEIPSKKDKASLYKYYYDTAKNIEKTNNISDQVAYSTGSEVDYECFSGILLTDIFETPLKYDPDRTSYAVEYNLRMKLILEMIGNNQLNCEVYFRIPRYVPTEYNYDGKFHYDIEQSIYSAINAADKICAPGTDNDDYYLNQSNLSSEKYSSASHEAK